MTQHLTGEFNAGDDPLTAGLNIRPLTKRLVDQLCLDLPLPLPVVVDFGVDTADHYRALRAICLNDPQQEDFDPDDQDQVNRELRKRIVELDQAYGNGPKLTALVKKYAPEYSELTFATAWDALAGRLAAGSERSEAA
jgi:hypothetical protein